MLMLTSVVLLLQALYNEYVHFKETEIPAKEIEKGHIEHLYKLLEVRMSRGQMGRNMNEGKGEQKCRDEGKGDQHLAPCAELFVHHGVQLRGSRSMSVKESNFVICIFVPVEAYSTFVS